MRRFATLYLIMFWVLNSFAQEFGTHWISCPMPNDSSQVLFYGAYDWETVPQRAFVSFASTGMVRVYVNERNVSHDIFFVNGNAGTAEVHTFDVTRYLVRGANSFAVWYAPRCDMPVGKQLSLQVFGKGKDGKPFLEMADKAWRCTVLDSCFSYEGEGVSDSIAETFSNADFDGQWKSVDYDHSKWQSACVWYGEKGREVSTALPQFPLVGRKLQTILLPIAEYEDSMGVHFGFARPFHGAVRLTLRGAVRGERILADGVSYICSGEMDEQVFRRFTTGQVYWITVSGDNSFRRSQIQKVEGLEISGR